MKTIKMIMMAVMMTIVTSASAMTYSQAKDQALFLADKMAYELDLTDEQYEAAYEINLDYLMAVNDYDDVYGTYWTRRNLELRSILASWQYDKYVAAEYFYRPVYWSNNRWNWRIYSHYSYDRYYKPRPKVYVTYKGGNDKRYYTSRSWSKPTKRTIARIENGNRTWTVQKAVTPKENTGNRTFGNGNRNSSTRTVAQAKSNNTRSFGARQSMANSSSNASKGTFGRR